MKGMFCEERLGMSATDIGGPQLATTSVAFAFDIAGDEMFVNL
jgi:hypothetical protein